MYLEAKYDIPWDRFINVISSSKVLGNRLMNEIDFNSPKTLYDVITRFLNVKSYYEGSIMTTILVM